MGDQCLLRIFGKGGKNREIQLKGPIWEDLRAFRGFALETDRVFRSREENSMSRSADQVQAIVRGTRGPSCRNFAGRVAALVPTCSCFPYAQAFSHVLWAENAWARFPCDRLQVHQF